MSQSGDSNRTEHQRWRETKLLFARAINLTPDVRANYLNQNASSREIAKEVASLCESTEKSDGFLLAPTDAPLDATQDYTGTVLANAVTLNDDALLGQEVGGFRLVRRLGLGAMGIVYEAQQSAPSRRAAIKILRSGYFCDPIDVQRFLHESEILAQLEHPGIVRVYASGTMPTKLGDVPWFAMEFIDGVSLTDWCKTVTSVAEKVRMLCQICDAVGHAHNRNVVHRDLKPANVLIVPPSDQSTNKHQVRIVDFGISRVVGQTTDERSFTRTGSIIGTIDYMSPEQFDGGEITAQSDVYALATVGYEMLTGRLPHPSNGKTIAEIITDRKNSSPLQLSKIDDQLRGDLEAVFARALAPNSDQRYASAVDLADDLRRYLDDRPVLARRPSTLSRLLKYVHRNRVAFILSTSVIAILAIGIVLYANEAMRAQQKADQFAYEAKKSRALNSFLTNDLFTSIIQQTQRYSEGNGRENLSAQQLLSKSTEKIDQLFGDSPLMEANARNEVGTLYYNLGLLDSAIAQYKQAEELWRENIGIEHADTLKAVSNLGLCYMQLGDATNAEARLVQALEGRRRVLTPKHPDLAVSLNNLSQLYRNQERFSESERLLKEAIEIGRAGDDLREPLTYTANLALTQIDQGNVDTGLARLQSAYEECVENFGQNDRLALQLAFSLANQYRRHSHYQRALEIAESALANRVESDALTISTRRLLAKILISLEEPESAEQCLSIALHAALAQPDEHAKVIEKLRRDINRLQRDIDPSFATEATARLLDH